MHQQKHQTSVNETCRPVAAEGAPPPEKIAKPEWLKARYSCCPEVDRIRQVLRSNKLHTVCEEATCPNIGECFKQGTATFLILGDTCTRNCPFCNVTHGLPLAPDVAEPENLARAVAAMGLRYVVITSVTRDDLPDGGAGHYAETIASIRRQDPTIQIEILVPDFRGREEQALQRLVIDPPDVFNHNLETVSRLYPTVRPAADYAASLALLRRYKELSPSLPTKSGIMLGFGETQEEVHGAMQDLRNNHCDMLTLGQYLRPSSRHLPVARYVPPEEFESLRKVGLSMGFSHVEAGPLVRSSYHAAEQAQQTVN
jgi:lipoic acid synthetase